MNADRFKHKEITDIILRSFNEHRFSRYEFPIDSKLSVSNACQIISVRPKS